MKKLTYIMGVLTILALSSQAQAKDVKTLKEAMTTMMDDKSYDKYTAIAQSILKHSKTYNVDPMFVVALLRTESSFDQFAVSSTGDLGIGQINPNVWGDEFIRLKRKPLNIERLKKDQDYAIQRTVEILSLIKKESDPKWIGRYHSKTPSLKAAYFEKIQNQINKVTPAAITLAINN